MQRLVTIPTLTGIRRDADQLRGGRNLVSCTGLRPVDGGGLKQHLTLTQPYSDALLNGVDTGKTWPWPQFFRGANVSLLCFETTIQTVSEESGWGRTTITTYDAAYFGNSNPPTKAIESGYDWHFLDMYGAWILFNGVSVVFKTAHNAKYWTTDAVTILSGCILGEGRVMYAGFNPSNIEALAAWSTYWATYGANAPSHVANLVAAGMGKNWAWWGSVNGGDTFWWLNTDLLMLGTQDGPFDNLCATSPNGTFSDATGWNGISGSWSIAGGALTGATVTADVTSTSSSVCTAGHTYRVVFTLTRSTGSVTVKLGSASGTLRDSAGTYTENVTCAGSGTITIVGAGFTGTVDNLTVQEVTIPSTGFSETAPMTHDLASRNECGARPMPWRTATYNAAVIPIGRTAAVVYSADGVAGLESAGNTFALREFAGYGTRVGAGVGGDCRTPVASSGTRHVWIDENGDMWTVTQDWKAERIGHKDIFASMIADGILGSYDAREEEFYLGTDAACYVFGRNGLSKAPWCPTQISAGGNGYAIKFDTSDAVEIITEEQEVDESLYVATLARIKVYGKNATHLWKATVQYRFDLGATWTSSDEETLDARGEATFNVPCSRYRIKLTATDRTKVSCEKIEVWLTDGKTELRQVVEATAPGAATE